MGTKSDVLSSVKCSVYVNLEDGGTDASRGIKAELQRLGAMVEDAFAFGHTHMVWTNGPSGLLEAAKALQIKPVSFLWVEQCKQAGKLVDETDFYPEMSYHSSKLRTDVNVVVAPTTVTDDMEPIINQVSSVRNPDSRFFHSSQREEEEEEEETQKAKSNKSIKKKGNGKSDIDKKTTTKENSSAAQLDASKKKTPKNRTQAQEKHKSDNNRNRKTIVPTAGFREITPRGKSSVPSNLKRRSERISDNNDCDSQSQEMGVATANVDQASVNRAIRKGKGASKDTVIPFQLEKPPVSKRGRKKKKNDNDIDATIPIAAQTQFSSPSFSQDPILSTIRPDTVMKVSFEGITSQLESGSQIQSHSIFLLNR